ncbi:MAG: type II toxin-antitoxin system HipA family toxin [Bacteriovoracaceae bacterium]
MIKGDVFFKNKRAGFIQKNQDQSYTFTYLNGSPVVSMTLKNMEEPHHSDELFPFFDGLIPEGWLLNLVQKNWKIAKDDRMTLLLSACQDCIGATHILPHNQIPLTPISHPQYMSTKNKFEMDRCLICMQDLLEEPLYHKKCANDLFGFEHISFVDVSTEKLEELALLQINQRLTLTGVQKKLSLAPESDKNSNRLTVVGLDGRFILKPSTEEYKEMSANEHLCMKLAELLGLNVAKCGLVQLTNGELAYVTKRFDRLQNEKIMMEDFCQLSLKPTSKKYSGSTESLGKVIEEYSDFPQDDKLTLFQFVLYSFIIGNADMHLKNFSLWQEPRSRHFRMSPGYDFLSTRLLISSKDDPEEMALTINGKKNKLKWKDFLELGKNLNLPEKVMKKFRDSMVNAYPTVEIMVYRSFLSEKKQMEFLTLMKSRLSKLITED